MSSGEGSDAKPLGSGEVNVTSSEKATHAPPGEAAQVVAPSLINAFKDNPGTAIKILANNPDIFAANDNNVPKDKTLRSVELATENGVPVSDRFKPKEEDALEKPQTEEELQKDLDDARLDYGRQIYGVKGWIRSDLGFKKVVEARERYTNALLKLKDKKVEQLEDRRDKDASLQEVVDQATGKTKEDILIENTMKLFSTDEALNLEAVKDQVRQERLTSGSVTERTKAATMKVLDKYRKIQSKLAGVIGNRFVDQDSHWAKRLAAMGAGSMASGMAIGIGTGGLSYLPVRVMGGLSSAVFFDKGLNSLVDYIGGKSGLKKQAEAKESFKDETGRTDTQKFSKWAEEQIYGQARNKAERQLRTGAIAVTAVAGAVGVSLLSRTVAEHGGQWFASWAENTSTGRAAMQALQTAGESRAGQDLAEVSHVLADSVRSVKHALADTRVGRDAIEVATAVGDAKNEVVGTVKDVASGVASFTHDAIFPPALGADQPPAATGWGGGTKLPDRPEAATAIHKIDPIKAGTGITPGELWEDAKSVGADFARRAPKAISDFFNGDSSTPQANPDVSHVAISSRDISPVSRPHVPDLQTTPASGHTIGAAAAAESASVPPARELIDALDSAGENVRPPGVPPLIDALDSAGENVRPAGVPPPVEPKYTYEPPPPPATAHIDLSGEPLPGELKDLNVDLSQTAGTGVEPHADVPSSGSGGGAQEQQGTHPPEAVIQPVTEFTAGKGVHSAWDAYKQLGESLGLKDEELDNFAGNMLEHVKSSPDELKYFSYVDRNGVTHYSVDNFKDGQAIPVNKEALDSALKRAHELTSGDRANIAHNNAILVEENKLHRLHTSRDYQEALDSHHPQAEGAGGEHGDNLADASKNKAWIKLKPQEQQQLVDSRTADTIAALGGKGHIDPAKLNTFKHGVEKYINSADAAQRADESAEDYTKRMMEKLVPGGESYAATKDLYETSTPAVPGQPEVPAAATQTIAPEQPAHDHAPEAGAKIINLKDFDSVKPEERPGIVDAGQDATRNDLLSVFGNATETEMAKIMETPASEAIKNTGYPNFAAYAKAATERFGNIGVPDGRNVRDYMMDVNMANQGFFRKAA